MPSRRRSDCVRCIETDGFVEAESLNQERVSQSRSHWSGGESGQVEGLPDPLESLVLVLVISYDTPGSGVKYCIFSEVAGDIFPGFSRFRDVGAVGYRRNDSYYSLAYGDRRRTVGAVEKHR